MGAPYSKDLRTRVLAAVDGSMSKWEVHQTFGVSRSTVDDWLKLRTETGGVKAKTECYRGRAPMLPDSAELRTFLEAHQGSTLAQLAHAWQEQSGREVSVKTFHKTLQRIGYTRKESTTDIKNAILRSGRLSSNSQRP